MIIAHTDLDRRPIEVLPLLSYTDLPVPIHRELPTD